MFDDIEFNVKEYAIKGKMVIGRCKLSEMDYSLLNLTDDEMKQKIKERLSKQLINYLLEERLAEFTMLKDPLSENKMFYVRCFLTPDDQVRILRINEKNILK